MSVPFRFDDSNTERSSADALLDFGMTEASRAASEKASRGDKSAGTVVLGGIPASANPMQISGPLPAYTQPGTNVGPVTTPVPPGHLDAMQVTTKPSNYTQPNNFTPASRAGTTPTGKNPMGL